MIQDIFRAVMRGLMGTGLCFSKCSSWSTKELHSVLRLCAVVIVSKYEQQTVDQRTLKDKSSLVNFAWLFLLSRRVVFRAKGLVTGDESL